MRIVKLTADNIKKLRAVEIVPDGPVVQISGANGAGKTSVLDSILWALGGTKTLDAQPIRDGEQRAAIVLDLGEMRVTRTFTRDNSYLKVETADGAVYKSPQALLDGLIGRLSFDPLAFSRADAKTQTEILIAATGLTLDDAALEKAAGRPPVRGSDPISTLRATYKAVFEDRKAVNRQVEQAKAALAAVPAVEPVTPVSVTDLMAEQQQLLTQRDAVRAHNAQGAALDAEMDRLTATRTRLQAELAACTEALAKVTLARGQWKPQSEPDFTAITERMAQADTLNAQARQYEARQQATAALATHEAQAAALTRQLRAIIDFQKELMASARFPVPGLGFNAEGVTYQDRPFAQASSAEQLRVSVALGIALNPTLRVMRIQDGSLCDSASMQILTELATQHDMQCWIEVVDESGAVGVYIEDGTVAAVNGVPVTETVAV